MTSSSIGKGCPGRPRAVSLAGQRFGRLTVAERACQVGDKRGAFWSCVCICGKTYVALGYRLRSGRTSECADCFIDRRAS